MNFEWDDKKNMINIRKHGIDFVDAVDIFNHLVLTLRDEQEDYGEERWIADWLKTLVGVVVYTERTDDMIRIIFARKVTKYEVCRYEKALKN